MQTVGTKNISFNQKIFSAHKILTEYEIWTWNVWRKNIWNM